jgi:hypothetical protein
MTSPGELVRVISEALGVPEPTVTQHDRNLVIAGLRSKGGRGRSAAKVTARDAAHLLTAVMGSALVKDSVEAVERYGATRIHKDTSSPSGFKDYVVPELAALSHDHSFLDGLEALIASAASGSLQRALYDAAEEVGGSKFPYVLPPIFVAVQTPDAIGDLRVNGQRRGTSRNVRYSLPYPEEGSFHERVQKFNELIEKYKVVSDADLKQHREVSSRTILSIGKVLSQ